MERTPSLPQQANSVLVGCAQTLCSSAPTFVASVCSQSSWTLQKQNEPSLLAEASQKPSWLNAILTTPSVCPVSGLSDISPFTILNLLMIVWGPSPEMTSVSSFGERATLLGQTYSPLMSRTVGVGILKR